MLKGLWGVEGQSQLLPAVPSNLTAASVVAAPPMPAGQSNGFGWIARPAAGVTVSNLHDSSGDGSAIRSVQTSTEHPIPSRDLRFWREAGGGLCPTRGSENRTAAGKRRHPRHGEFSKTVHHFLAALRENNTLADRSAAVRHRARRRDHPSGHRAQPRSAARQSDHGKVFPEKPQPAGRNAWARDPSPS